MALPYARDLTKLNGFRLQLLDPNDSNPRIPQAACRAPSLIRGGLLDGWHADAVRAMKRPQAPLEGWEQVVWNDEDDRFISQLTTCTSPEEVEAIMPRKWLTHPPDRQVDERLAQVCDLCTALVDRFVALEGAASGPTTTAQWREHETLRELIEQVVAILEASIGEAITPAALRVPSFLRRCWQLLCPEEQSAMESLLLDDSVSSSLSRGAAQRR